jgi:hypothetical protein
MNERNTDSLRNENIRDLVLLPSVFFMAISVALLDDFAVERFM